jgi:hypothetical protein
LGAAILCNLAYNTDRKPDLKPIITAMARQRPDPIYRPNVAAQQQYDKLYALYRNAAQCDGVLARAMRELRAFS